MIRLNAMSIPPEPKPWSCHPNASAPKPLKNRKKHEYLTARAPISQLMFLAVAHVTLPTMKMIVAERVHVLFPTISAMPPNISCVAVILKRYAALHQYESTVLAWRSSATALTRKVRILVSTDRMNSIIQKLVMINGNAILLEGCLLQSFTIFCIHSDCGDSVLKNRFSPWLAAIV
jgi:hypothetical protein